MALITLSPSSGSSIGDLDVPPAFEAREHHEQVARTVAFVPAHVVLT